MDRITIWLADENEHYVELLKRYIRTSNYKNRLSIAAYTDYECFKHTLEHIHSEAIVLVSALFIPLCSELIHSTVILLSEAQSQEIADHPNQVYKYRPLNQLLDQVLNIYYERKGDVRLNTSVSEAKPRVIAVYSASGGSGVTTLSVQLSEFIASLGKRVFYLNLETIHGMLSSSKDATMTRFTQVLYMIKSGQPLLGKLHQLLQSDHAGHYDLFHPTRYSREWLEYEREDIQLLLHALKHTGRYDVIIIDVGSSLFSHTIGALEYSDEIFWVIPDRPGSIAKAEYVRDELSRLSSQLHDSIRNRSKYVIQLYSASVVMMPNPSIDINTLLPFISEWQHSSAGAPPSSYRHGLLRLIGMATEEEMNQIGATTGDSLHRLA
ncbi:MAG: AAA family ATPase [Paenibacillaceae bacterium]